MVKNVTFVSDIKVLGVVVVVVVVVAVVVEVVVLVSGTDIRASVDSLQLSEGPLVLLAFLVPTPRCGYRMGWSGWGHL